jgi:hypothetical protein
VIVVAAVSREFATAGTKKGEQSWGHRGTSYGGVLDGQRPQTTPATVTSKIGNDLRKRAAM